MIFLVPSRGLIGYSTEFLSLTRGYGIMSHTFEAYLPELNGKIGGRRNGALVSTETGKSTTYGIMGVEDRGTIFIEPGVDIYEGMVVGETNRGEDIVVNVCKKKHVTNTRAAGSDDALRLITPISMSLENSIEFLADDELLEITPNNLRIRKKILDKSLRAKSKKN